MRRERRSRPHSRRRRAEKQTGGFRSPPLPHHQPTGTGQWRGLPAPAPARSCQSVTADLSERWAHPIRQDVDARPEPSLSPTQAAASARQQSASPEGPVGRGRRAQPHPCAPRARPSLSVLGSQVRREQGRGRGRGLSVRSSPPLPHTAVEGFNLTTRKAFIKHVTLMKKLQCFTLYKAFSQDGVIGMDLTTHLKQLEKSKKDKI